MEVLPELRQIQKEYHQPGKFFDSVRLDEKSTPPLLKVRTLELNDFNVSVAVKGWFYENDSQDIDDMGVQFFPTFEGLANEISERFRAVWASELINRINRLR
ncbi:unnamed protein product [Ambrosiozyma monospora]|uniref:Unnamed protein product n=1 Tax=Ambrosiozyma monospora TaxID=43982 RepID=A0A9W6YU78_AMBMO|nr:unnamed protein product [Ambrosiozyma monospora]